MSNGHRTLDLMSPMEFLPSSTKGQTKQNAMPAMQFGPKVPNLPSMKKHADFPIQPFKEESRRSDYGDHVGGGGGAGQLDEIERHKLEADAIRFKMGAEDAAERAIAAERQAKLQSEELSNLKIALNAERARHAETAEQSRALTHLAAQLRLKNERLERSSEKYSQEARQLRKRVATSDEELLTQTARVDALTKICQALEAQVRQITLERRNGAAGDAAELDIADRWRKEAYKFLVQMSYTESKLSAENRKLVAELAKKKPTNRSSRHNSPAPPLPDFVHSKNKSF